MSDTDEEFVPEDEEESGAASIKKLRERLAKAIEEKQEYLEGWQRSRADFANFKREEALISSGKEDRVKSELAQALIPALDAFDMAFKDKSFADADPALKKGIESLYQGLQKSLEKVGIKRHWPLGEPFSPHVHEALREVPTEDASLDHTVEGVLAAGYSIGDLVIRPAQVSVWSHNNS